jgi:hypothetical protein
MALVLPTLPLPRAPPDMTQNPSLKFCVVLDTREATLLIYRCTVRADVGFDEPLSSRVGEVRTVVRSARSTVRAV